MRLAKTFLCILSVLGVCAMVERISAQTPAQKRIVIAASTVFDGKGHVLRNTRIVIEGSKIVAIDLSEMLFGAQLLPGALKSSTAWGRRTTI